MVWHNTERVGRVLLFHRPLTASQTVETRCADVCSRWEIRHHGVLGKLWGGFKCFTHAKWRKRGKTRSGTGGGRKKKDRSSETDRKHSPLGPGDSRLEVLETSVLINNAAHICATSWPHTFFSDLRHRGSSPRVSTHFRWQQRRRRHVCVGGLNSEPPLPAGVAAPVIPSAVSFLFSNY